MRLKKFGRAVVAAAATMALAVGTATAAQATDLGLPTPENPGGVESPTSPGGVPANGYGPDKHTWVGATTYARMHPGLSPMGTNDFTCTPQPGESPVVLVPGTGTSAYGAWAMFGPHLAQRGLCLFTFNYNPSGNPVDEMASFNGDIRQSAAFLAGFVDRVLEATGAEKVTLVGHSQGGGPLPRAYLKWYGGAEKVDHLIGLSPNNHGTTMMGLKGAINYLVNKYPNIEEKLSADNMDALLQQLEGSEFLTELNDGGLTVPGVKYTVLTTKYDTTVTPYTNAFIDEPGVENILIQDVCPMHAPTHPNITYSSVALQMVGNMLDADNQQPVRCGWMPPYLK
ncbi:MAG: alpha/beta fold hydrolase [Trueperella sp.]|nr:alpha/beta fold hydrolase [Trueperella sp.]